MDNDKSALIWNIDAFGPYLYLNNFYYEAPGITRTSVQLILSDHSNSYAELYKV